MHADDRPHPDVLVARLAARQHGVVARAQLERAGLSRSAVAHRVSTGRLHRIHAGVFLVGHTASAPFSGETAALLACGPGTILSHETAAVLWRLRPPSATGPVHVTALRKLRDRPGIRTHRTTVLDARHRHGLPLTTPARTLLDLATTLGDRDLGWALNEALVLRLVRTGELEGIAGRWPGRRGAARLRRAIRTAAPDAPTATRSEAERVFIDLIRRARLPLPDTNVRLAGHRVDAVWRDARLVVEIDGFAFHGTRAAFERDRRRDADLAAAGHHVLRLSWRQLTDAPEAVAAALSAALIRPGVHLAHAPTEDLSRLD